MCTVCSHTHSIITSSNARAWRAVQNCESKGLLSRVAHEYELATGFVKSSELNASSTKVQLKYCRCRRVTSQCSSSASSRLRRRRGRDERRRWTSPSALAALSRSGRGQRVHCLASTGSEHADTSPHAVQMRVWMDGWTRWRRGYGRMATAAGGWRGEQRRDEHHPAAARAATRSSPFFK